MNTTDFSPKEILFLYEKLLRLQKEAKSSKLCSVDVRLYSSILKKMEAQYPQLKNLPLDKMSQYLHASPIQLSGMRA